MSENFKTDSFILCHMILHLVSANIRFLSVKINFGTEFFYLKLPA